MYKLTYRIIILYLLIFSVPKLLDIFLGSVATVLEILLITALWFYTFIGVRIRLTKKEKAKADFFLIILFLGILWLLGTSLIFRNIPIAVVIYRIIPYGSFYPLVYLFIYLKRKAQLIKKILVFTILLCNFTSLGVIYDFSGGLVDTPFIGNKILILEKESGTVQYKTRGGQRRGSFLIGGSTAVYPFLSLGILSSLLLFYLEKEKDKYLWGAIINLVLLWLGCFCSLSRSPLFLATTIGLYCFLKLLLFSRAKQIQRKFLLIVIVVGIIFAIPMIQYQLQQQLSPKSITILQSGLSTQEKANSRRYTAWYKGSLLFTDSESWIGYGLGTSNLAVKQNKLLAREQYRYHYESSIFSTFSEGGIIGLCILLIPFIIIIWSSKSSVQKDIFIVWGFLLLLNLFVAPIYDYSSQIAYFMGMSLCCSLKPKKKNILYPRNVSIIKNYETKTFIKIIKKSR